MGEVGEGDGSNTEILSKEDILSLPGRIYDHCTGQTQDIYRRDPTQPVYLFHTYHEADGSQGHVENVSRVTQLYLDAVKHATEQKGLTYPNDQCDPLGIYNQARNSTNKLSDKDLMHVVETTFITSAMLHDMGNVANSIDWELIKQTSQANQFDGVVVTNEMRSYYTQNFGTDVALAEKLSAKIFSGFLAMFSQELGLDKESLSMAQTMGKALILNTAKDVECDGEFKQLALFDKTAAPFSENGYQEVWGLMNEWGTNGIRGAERDLKEGWKEIRTKSIAAQLDAMNTIFPDTMFERFVLDTSKKYNSAQGKDATGKMNTVLQQYYKDHHDECISLLGIPSEQSEQIENIPAFVEERLALRGQVGALLWTKPKSKSEVNPIFLLQTPRVISEPKYSEWVARSSNLFKQRFWDPTLEIQDFEELYVEIFGKKPCENSGS
ncbi:MAG: hypothetical protein Q8P72_05685 [Candidatus Roizmanbacteria bacterium]|nr:hypothetical protein [Candidatus Roizmanbacteria bacterium]